MKARRQRRSYLGVRFDDWLATRRTRNDATVDVEPISLKDHAGIGAGCAVEPGLCQINRHAFGLGRQAEQCQLRGRPIGDKGRSLAGIGERDGGADFAIQQRRTKHLRGKSEVAGTDVKRRAIAVKSGACLIAMDHNSEWEASDGLGPAGVNAAKRGLTTDPACQCLAGDRGCVGPQRCPADRQRHDDGTQENKAPKAPTRWNAAARASGSRSHHAQRRLCRHHLSSPLVVAFRRCALVALFWAGAKFGHTFTRPRCSLFPIGRGLGSPMIKTAEHHNKDLWVFAYGSLMWRPEFSYRER